MTPGSAEFSAFVALFAACVSAVSAGGALASVLLTRKNWRESNRPVVTAYVDEESGSEGLTMFNLYIKNTGNRPAVSVQLSAKSGDIERLVEEQTEEKRRRHIETVFTRESRLSVLLPDEMLVTSFGLASTSPDQKWLKYGEEIEAQITYRDLERREYTSHLWLRTRPRKGFGGGVWQSAT